MVTSVSDLKEPASTLKASLAFAALDADDRHLEQIAKCAGVSVKDVTQWRDHLSANAARLFETSDPQEITALRSELHASHRQLTMRYQELAVLTRLLEDRRRLLPRLDKQKFRDWASDFREKRASVRHSLGTTKIKVVSAMPVGVKHTIKSALRRLRLYR